MIEELTLTYDPETENITVAADILSVGGLIAMTDAMIRTVADKLDMDRDRVLENFMGLANED